MKKLFSTFLVAVALANSINAGAADLTNTSANSVAQQSFTRG